ncbi:hypothetical protein ACFP2T_34990 [Plantactinospora solaniradicis]|uniref:Glycoside hydrolase family 65 N-terminal domain-containing protein n=1 Tax=Plantactinospora solaniradicis TaxID=1723736 RepID=A0ABW1KI09_9ACTN
MLRGRRADLPGARLRLSGAEPGAGRSAGGDPVPTLRGRPVDPTADGTDRHERILDLRDGTLRRSFGWTAPSGAAVAMRSTRLVSFVHPAVLAIRYEIVATDRPVRIRLHSELRANPSLPERDTDDPRAPIILERPLLPERHTTDGLGGVLAHRTRHSRQRIVAAVTHLLDGPQANVDVDVDTGPDLVRVAVETRLAPGPATPGDQTGRVRLVRAPTARRPDRRRGYGARGGRPTRLGRTPRRPAGLPRQVLGGRRRRRRR